MKVVLRRRLVYVLRDLSWALASLVGIVVEGPTLLIGSPLGRSPLGLLLGVAGLLLLAATVVVVAYRKMNSATPVLSDEGLRMTRRSREAVPWNRLHAIRIKTRVASRGTVGTVELQFGDDQPIYIDDWFTVSRDRVAGLALDYAHAAGAKPTLTAENGPSAGSSRTAWAAVGIWLFSILIVLAMVLTLGLHHQRS